MEDGDHADGYYSNRDSFITPYQSVSYHGDTLVATTLHEVNTCAKTVADVRLSHDTLFLLIDRKDKGGCASVEFRLFRYVVRVPEGEKYHVVF